MPVELLAFLGWHHAIEKARTMHAQLSLLGFPTYSEYLKSEHWRQRRKKFSAGHPIRCFVCGTRKRPIELHHLSYDRLGDELDSDLVWLCQRHHSEAHKLVMSGKESLHTAHTQVAASARKSRLQRTKRTPARVPRSLCTLDDAADALEWAGVARRPFSFRDRKQKARLATFIVNSVCTGTICWENDRLKVVTTFRKQRVELWPRDPFSGDEWERRLENAKLWVAAIRKR